MTTPTAAGPERLPWTGDEEADGLIATDATALLIGFVLDQQVTVQKAFSGPRVIRERLGSVDARALAAMEPERVREAFVRSPAIHRFPGTMAERVQALCRVLADEHGGDAADVWRGAGDGADLERRLTALPGIGPMKARILIAVLGKRYGVRPTGWESRIPEWMTLADADTPERLAEYQARKRAAKAERAGRDATPPARSRG